MAASKGSSNFNNTSSLNFDLGSRSTSSSNQHSSAAGFDDLFGASSPFNSSSTDFAASKSVNLPPVYDKPIYDDDIFDGVPGLKSSSSSKVPYDDVFASPAGNAAAFDDLLGGFNQSKRSEKDDKGVADFDDLIPGFGSSKHSSERPAPDSSFSSESNVGASKTASGATEDPFKVFESASAPMDSSSGHFTDPLDEISKFTSSRNTKVDSSSNSNGVVYDDTDPFDGLGNSIPAFSSERNSRNGSSSPTPRSDTNSSWTRDKESIEKSSVKSPGRQTQNKIPVKNDQEFHQAPYDMPTYSSDSNKPVGQRSTSPSYDNDGFTQVNTQADMSPKYEEKLDSNDDIWLTVSEIPLFTQPTAAPPPSRPPPPRPVHIPKSGTGLPASANARKKDNEFSSFPSSTRFSQGHKSAPAAAKLSSASQFDELEDFAMGSQGRSRGNDDERRNGLPDEELEMNSAAAAMKEAMDRAEAKFRHAKEVRERENTKAARSKEPVQLEKNDRAVPEEREKQEWAAAEARERAAAEARERAAAAARMNQQKNENDLESFFSMGARANNAPRPPRASSSDSAFDAQFQPDVTRKSTSVSSNMKKASSSTNIVDDLSSIFGASPSSGEFQEVDGESEERRKARLERHQRAQERAAKALAEKNQRDLQTQREQAERHRLAETLDFEIKRWAAGKEGNLRALLSTLQYVLWPECGWQPVSLTDLITAAAVKKAYRKATLCIHPDKVQQKGATLQQKYVAEKVFDLLKKY
ncbi:Chaperone J-domain superfamily [Sesbania bispinosa]|nr:Chaperone J-domain superfamily [Sesbania bispinosa]